MLTGSSICAREVGRVADWNVLSVDDTRHTIGQLVRNWTIVLGSHVVERRRERVHKNTEVEVVEIFFPPKPWKVRSVLGVRAEA